MQPPLLLLLLFPSAHIHCDSSLQPYSYQRDTTNFNFSHWLVCSHSSSVTLQTQRSWMENVTVGGKGGALEKPEKGWIWRVGGGCVSGI